MKLLPLLFLPSILAFQLSGLLDIKNPSSLDNNAKALLTSTSLRLNSPIFQNPSINNLTTFQFNSIPIGNYLLQFDSKVYSFDIYLVQVREGEGTMIGKFIPGFERNLDELPEFSLNFDPLVVVGKEWKGGQSKKSFNLWEMITANPIVPLLAIGAIAAMGLPKLLELVDPATMAEVTAQQAKMHSSVGNLTNLGQSDIGISKFLAGKTKDHESEGVVKNPVEDVMIDASSKKENKSKAKKRK